MTRRSKTLRAFTLVELLVVIGIIALLIAILFPALNRGMAKAREVNCLSNARQLAIGVMMYVNDYKGIFPPSADYSAPTAEPSRVWTIKLLPYLKSEAVYVCPAVPEAKFSRDWNERGVGTIGYTTATAYDPLDVEGFSTMTKISMIKRSSLTPLFGDSAAGPTAQRYRGFTFEPYNGQANVNDPVLGTPLVSDKDLVQELNQLSPAQLKPLLARHFGRVVLIFADAHAQSVEWKSILLQEKGAAFHWRFRPKPANAP
jgi:prepilin-type N-terminal cleavage/methylation domain-containing protein